MSLRGLYLNRLFILLIIFQEKFFKFMILLKSRMLGWIMHGLIHKSILLKENQEYSYKETAAHFTE